MNSDSTGKLVLTTLKNGLPAITPAYGEAMAEAAAVCFEQQNHFNGVELLVEGAFTEKLKVYWPSVTDQMLSVSITTKAIQPSKQPMGSLVFLFVTSQNTPSSTGHVKARGLIIGLVMKKVRMNYLSRVKPKVSFGNTQR